MAIPTADELVPLGDGELLDLLDLVSNEVKRRNSLRPATAGKAAVEVMKAISDATKTRR